MTSPTLQNPPAAAAPTQPARVLVVVNKWWECDPVLGALLHEKARPRSLPWPDPLRHPRRRPNQSAHPAEDPTPQPRAVLTLTNVAVEVWCISDLLEDLKDVPELQSSSERKVARLPRVFAGAAPRLVVAVGTAGYPLEPGEPSLNGSVAIGTRVFMYDAHPGGENQHSRWQDDRLGKALASSLTPEQFRAITSGWAESAEPRLLPPPLNPATRPLVLPGYTYTAVGSVNVTDYADYAWADHAALAAQRAADPRAPAASLETTHGLIRVQSEAPFLWVSGITDRVGVFDREVTPREYAQNFACAHNAGVVVGWMLPRIDAALA